MKLARLILIALIFVCTSLGWAILGGALQSRTSGRGGEFESSIADGWGPPMQQPHPVVSYASPTSPNGRKQIQPAASDVQVRLEYEPKSRGLFRYRTYRAQFRAEYRIENPTPITQTMTVAFGFPAGNNSYESFTFMVGDRVSNNAASAAKGIVEAVTLAPGASVPVKVAYTTRGVDRWQYAFGEASRVRNFSLTLFTDFTEIDFPAGTGSPTQRERAERGWRLDWKYPDVINARDIGMSMPSLLNPAPVAQRITFFAPVSLLFFFAVLVLVGMVRGINYHPMHYFFFAAGFFAFQLLFAYLVDLVPLHLAFVLASIVSLVLVGGYIQALSGWAFARFAILAQFAYLVLFSYTFFFEGLTGLTITIGAIATLALLMRLTVKTDWEKIFTPSPRTHPPEPLQPPPLPAESPLI
ncbi:MAG: hypothetical protein JSR82_18210 [Verrucomicrobia bacterium]|nr:hypothetical protein [Verrucomicrobiota bacterium]